MEAIYHPATYNTIGTVEKSPESGLFFAQGVDEENDYKEYTGLAVFRTKRSAEAFVKREFKKYKTAKRHD